VPLGIALVVSLIPAPILAEHRALADAAQERPVSRIAAAIIVTVWAISIAGIGWLMYRYFSNQATARIGASFGFLGGPEQREITPYVWVHPDEEQ
jgi:hypothetical protein